MKNLTIIILMSLALLTAACNTMQGLGQDIKTGGQKLENAAR
ncbi:MAG TPA: entericidin A/B family lipoprotein [Alphaproteobacteria bacterium]